MKKLKILSVGCEVNPKNRDGIKSGILWQTESFSEYDVLIIDPIDMDKFEKHPDKNSLATYVKRRPEEIGLLLEKTGGIVVCFLRENQNNRYVWLPSRVYTESELTPSAKAAKLEEKKTVFVEGGSGGGSVTHNGGANRAVWEFSQGDFKFTHRAGKEIKYIDKTSPFSQYFEKFKNEISFEVIINEQETILTFSKIIAKSRTGEAIAFELPFGPGKFIFLPPPPNTVDKDKLFGVLLDCIKKSFEWTEPLSKPDWLNKYPLDKKREKEIEEGIADIEEKIQKMLQQEQNWENERKKFELLKSLLYAQGKFGLEPPVREAFKILGFNVLESDDYDLYIKEGELWIIGEIEGTIGQIDVKKMRELHDYVSAETIDKDKNCKGILIGNGYIKEVPDKRSEQFTEHAIKGCKKYKYCRMTTYELFKAVQTVISEPDNKELKQSIKEQILKCEGEFKLREDKGANSS